MDLLTIFVGLVTAALLIHIRGAYVLAEKQQSAITRLHAYVLHWQSWVLDNDVFSVFYLGVEWNEEIDKRLACKEGPESLVALKEEKRNKIAEIKEGLEKDASTFDVEKLKKQLAKLPPNSVDHILRYSERFQQNLLEGKTFLTDEDASSLGPHYAHLCVDLKMHLIELGNKAISLLVTFIGSPDSFSVKDSAKEISEIIWKGVLVSKDIDTLSKAVNKDRTKSVVRRTWKNMWS